ncbi:MAG: threonylcarbamoyl-AMP synthase [Planctomycetaceae bacterium]|nr:threonylcarbamoyl-AMP synthase [Planctomycetaceae bacterium]
MRTRRLQVDPDDPSPQALEEAASILRGGGLVAFATETVYGLGAVATNSAAVERIFQAKGRPAGNPLIVHLEEIDQARPYVADWPESAACLAAQFWPGPLTLVLRRSSLIPPVVSAGRETVALRVPVTKVARMLIAAAGQPLAAPSANTSNRISPTCAAHVLADLDGRIEMVLESGHTSIGLESTVLDLTTYPPRILRPGPIGPEEIERGLGRGDRVEFSHHDPSSAQAPVSPGMLPRHYAPLTRAIRLESARELANLACPERTAVVVFAKPELPDLPGFAQRVDLEDPETAGRSLYSIMHRLDECGLELIVVVMPPDLPAWRTIRDRLIRAAQSSASGH